MYTHVMLIWLINVYWMLPLAWQKYWMIEALLSKISIPSTFPFPPSLWCYFKNPASIIVLSSFSHSLFYFRLYKISNDSAPFGNLWLCGLIRYNRFQSSGNKSNETEEVKFLRSRNWLYLYKKNQPQTWSSEFNIFGSCEYEKMDIL